MRLPYDEADSNQGKGVGWLMMFNDSILLIRRTMGFRAIRESIHLKPGLRYTVKEYHRIFSNVALFDTKND